MSAPPPGASTRNADTPRHALGLRQTLRKLWQTAAVWAVAVTAATAWWTHQALQAHREEGLLSAARRLDNLQGAIDLSLRQLGALPGALSRQADVVTFLTARGKDVPVTLDDTQRQQLREQAVQDRAWREVNQHLQDEVQELGVGRILLNSANGTVIGDSAFDKPHSAIGINNRGRRYFVQALEHPNGKGSQFAVSKTLKNPSLYFSSRVGSAEAPLGVVVVAQDVGALDRLFDDPMRRIFLTDDQGVVLAGNHAGDLLKRSPLSGVVASNREDDLRLYQQLPAPLN